MPTAAAGVAGDVRGRARGAGSAAPVPFSSSFSVVCCQRHAGLAVRDLLLRLRVEVEPRVDRDEPRPRPEHLVDDLLRAGLELARVARLGRELGCRRVADAAVGRADQRARLIGDDDVRGRQSRDGVRDEPLHAAHGGAVEAGAGQGQQHRRGRLLLIGEEERLLRHREVDGRLRHACDGLDLVRELALEGALHRDVLLEVGRRHAELVELLVAVVLTVDGETALVDRDARVVDRGGRDEHAVAQSAELRRDLGRGERRLDVARLAGRQVRERGHVARGSGGRDEVEDGRDRRDRDAADDEPADRPEPVYDAEDILHRGG